MRAVLAFFVFFLSLRIRNVSYIL